MPDRSPSIRQDAVGAIIERLDINRRAFTLIELLVVISIISLLSSVVLASLNSAREKARIAAGNQFESGVYHSIGSEAIVVWNMEEGGGNPADMTGNGNNGTISGATWVTDTPHPNSRYALSFASGNYVSFSKSLGIANSNFTIAMWVKTTSSAGQMYTIGNAGSGEGFRFGLGSGKVAFLVGNGPLNESQCGTKVVNDGKWHHIAGVFDRTGLRFICYVDGALSGTVGLASFYTNMYDAAPRLGAPPCCVPFVGSIDDVRIYGANLDGASIYGLYASSAGRFHGRQATRSGFAVK